MSEEVRVLHYIKHLETGGGETLLLNIYKNINRDKVQFDFLVNQEAEERLDKTVYSLGGKKIPLFKEDPKSNIKEMTLGAVNMYKILSEKKYDIIHIHCANAQGMFYAYIAKLAGVRVRIVHSHFTGISGDSAGAKKLVHNILKHVFKNSPTNYFACSELAAKWVFAKKIIERQKYKVIKNGIELEKYRFNKDVRKAMRNEIDCENDKVICSIGRNEFEKNQVFLLQILKVLIDKQKDYRLILIGKGSYRIKLDEYIKENKLQKYVRIIDQTDNVEKYLWCSDIFVLPSIYEGLGIVAIEAQAAGLKTLASDNIPQEAFATSLIEQIELAKGATLWADKIEEMINKPCSDYDVITQLKERGYDIKLVAEKLEQFYLETAKQN